MNKTDLAVYIRENCEGDVRSKAAATRIVEATLEGIMVALENGDDVVLPPVGKLVVKVQNARTARNPHTGDPIHVPEKNVVRFKAGKALKDRVNG